MSDPLDFDALGMGVISVNELERQFTPTFLDDMRPRALDLMFHHEKSLDYYDMERLCVAVHAVPKLCSQIHELEAALAKARWASKHVSRSNMLAKYVTYHAVRAWMKAHGWKTNEYDGTLAGKVWECATMEACYQHGQGKHGYIFLDAWWKAADSAESLYEHRREILDALGRCHDRGLAEIFEELLPEHGEWDAT